MKFDHTHWSEYYCNFLGLQTRASIVFCGHEERCVTLIRHGLFPGTITNPTVAYDLSFLELGRCLMVEGKMKLSKICDVIEMFNQNRHRISKPVSMKFLKIILIFI